MVGSVNVNIELVILHNGNNRISRAQSTLLDLARRNTLLNNVYYYYYYYYYYDYDNIRFPDSQKKLHHLSLSLENSFQTCKTEAHYC